MLKTTCIDRSPPGNLQTAKEEHSMNSSNAYEHRYQYFVWHLPPADPQAWLAAAVSLHHLFDAIFTNKTWVCRNLNDNPATFVPIKLAQISEGSISLSTCHQSVVAAFHENQGDPDQGEHVIVCGKSVDRTQVTCWQPRTGLIMEIPENRDSMTVTWLQQQNTFNDPAFPELLKRTLHGLTQLVLHGVSSTADIAETVCVLLSEQTPVSPGIEVTGNLFIQRFAANAAKMPERLAIVTDRESISYGELTRITDRIVYDWRYLKLVKGNRLLMIAPRGPEIVATVIAAFKAGVAVCLVDPRQPDTYIETCCRIVCPTFIVNLTGRDLTVQGIPVVTTINLIPYDEEEVPPISEDGFSADDCAVITLTSGTTHEPKAVMGRYSSLTQFFDWMDERLGPMADAAFGMCSSIGHDPLQRDIMTPLYLGGHIVIPGERDLNEPQRLSRWLAENRIEFVCLNAALVPWLSSSIPLQHLRALFCVGGALTRSQAVMLCQIAPNAQIVNLYGATETQRAVGFFELPRDPKVLANLPDVVPLGRGMKEVDLIVRGLSRLKMALPYQIGEIVLRSPYLALGYAGDPELTTLKFRNDIVPESSNIRTYLTGDLGYVSLCHGVVFTGRMDDQYKISGYRVEPTAIDDTCRQHPDVKNAATLVMEVEGLPTLVTCIVSDGVIAQDKLRHWLSQRLPHYMVPHRLCMLSDLPLTLNRKVDMRALAALVISENEHNDANAANAHAVKMVEQIVAFVNRHTGLNNPPRDVALADLGIDSLRFLALLSQLASASGHEKPSLGGLHNRMSIATIAQALEGRILPDSSLSKAGNIGVGYNLRDLLGPAIEVTETRISFAHGVFDHCCSNSYLGLAGCPEIRTQIAHFIDQGQVLGAHGSAELNGFTLWHEQLNTAIGEIYGCEAVLLYGSGYLANISAIATVVSGDDHLFVDESCHQSLIDGCRLSGAKISVYRHNDVDDLESLLSGTPRRPNTVWAIVTEGVFSIEGDILDLPSVHVLARRFDCRLIVDEACSLGLLGVDGSGVETHFSLPGAIDVRTGTMAKALASTGGYVTCRTGDLMRLRFQRGASFSTSLSALNAFIALQGVKRLRQDGRALKASLDRNVTLWRESLNALGFDTGQSSTAIVPILCTDSVAVTALFQRALDLGVYALPVSPLWSKRVHAVRTSVTSAHEPERLRDIVARFIVDI
ncbi:aminotransferase class I/II-fold pyridoxal phosphate-dependent enzyme [Salmonella enterica]|nr:aminotransferase class I/II-fold pyridoxal phosphate-dependent enzyme [Salmonella enterica]EHQ9196942.1 aminotransferase class I/II-fold pyridoxal phosphate-dependent enzyme [Salmonella enterica subsp. diarizonae serovar 50:k:z:[z50],[z57],[z68], [z86]]EEO7835815.1 aminotransferase class I/II-fold pyridoxal phosphate-dependent enzyme [Salmonella enterica]EHK0864499.1 aminotransferase class I/II-fold pyridoxal phosphate-dependent enzyme [Salmonella enterica]EIB1833736.1 aminotransferase class